MVLAVSPSVTFASNTVATPTDGMRRDNQQREAITQVSQNEAFSRESGLGAGSGRAPMAGVTSFANQLAGARQDAENIRRRAVKSEEEPEKKTGELTPAEQKKVDELKERDAEVRRHEQAHASAGGQYAGSPSYETEQGPDGRSYAVGGSVDIDVTPIADDPAATIQKMQIVQRAALGVDEPSAADRNIANEAARHTAKARQEMAAENTPDNEEINTIAKPSSHIESTYQGSFLPRENTVFAQA